MRPAEEKPLQYFERSTGSTFHRFKYEELFEELGKKLNEKIPTEWAWKLTNGNTSSYAVNTTWRIDFQIFGLKIGPYSLDLREYVNDFATLHISRVIRLVLLFVLCVYFLLSILNLLFTL